MKSPHFHLDTLCIFVLLVALDLGWYCEFVRHGLNHTSFFGFSDRGFDVSILPMLTVLAIGFYHIIIHRARSAFLLGFVISGLVATLAFMLWIWTAPQSVADVLMIRPFPSLVRSYRWGGMPVEVFALAGSIIDSSLPLFAAFLGGCLAQWMATRRETLRSAPSR